jgi:hypothetical protein
MRIITEDNVDQLLNMSYSDNARKLLKMPESTPMKEVFNKFSAIVNQMQNEQSKQPLAKIPVEEPVLPSEVETSELEPQKPLQIAEQPLQIAEQPLQAQQITTPISPEYPPETPESIIQENKTDTDILEIPTEKLNENETKGGSNEENIIENDDNNVNNVNNDNNDNNVNNNNKKFVINIPNEDASSEISNDSKKINI